MIGWALARRNDETALEGVAPLSSRDGIHLVNRWLLRKKKRGRSDPSLDAFDAWSRKDGG